MPVLARHFRSFVLLACVLAPFSARAWWNDDFKQRTKVTLNTSASGVTTSEAISGVAVPVRLHSGNFDFVGAKPDGSDLRAVAADDKTPLKFWLERFDSANEIAVIWVQVPLVAPGSATNVLYIYAGNAKAVAEPASPVVDSGSALTLRFSDGDGVPRDAAGGPLTISGPVATEKNGLTGSSARFDGTQMAELAAVDRLKAAAGAPYSVSLWARPDGASGSLVSQGPLNISLDRGKVVVKLAKLQFEGGELPPSAWVHVGLMLGGGKATLYVAGAQAAQADLPAGGLAIDGPIRIGQGYSGLLDEVQVAGVARSADWMKFTRASQGADAKLIASELQHAGQAEDSGSGQGGYIGILVKNLTVDAWVVIGILGVMFVVAAVVMVGKMVFVMKAHRDNLSFLERFRSATTVELLQLDKGAAHPHSSLFRLYGAGLRELRRRHIGQADASRLSGASLNAVKASIDADLVRESQRLNAQMVWLTIAISGGPFLGLLGTVVGVMITFAAIAAAGDVNVNAIAPGIAAALLATVAGLTVAIPSLFGYNYLSSRIRNISSDMQIFVDEFVTRVDEVYGAA